MTDNVLHLSIYGTIQKGSPNSYEEIKRVLDEHPTASEIHLRIDSGGGEVNDGNSIYQTLIEYPAPVTATVVNKAYSMASIIAMAADHLIMGPTAMLMVHNPIGACQGNAKDLRAAAETLDSYAKSLRQAYLMKANGKITEDQIQELMDKETYLSAKECLELGLCDEVIGFKPEVENNVEETPIVDESPQEENEPPMKGWLF